MFYRVPLFFNMYIMLNVSLFGTLAKQGEQAHVFSRTISFLSTRDGKMLKPGGLGSYVGMG